MHERRAELIAMEFPDYKEAVLIYIDQVTEKRSAETEAKIKVKCDENFDSVMEAIRVSKEESDAWKRAHQSSLQEIGNNAKAAADGSHANGLAIQALTESLSATIAVEHVGRQSISVISSVSSFVYGFAKWLKESLYGIAAVIFAVGLITGTIHIGNILPFFK